MHLPRSPLFVIECSQHASSARSCACEGTLRLCQTLSRLQLFSTRKSLNRCPLERLPHRRPCHFKGLIHLLAQHDATTTVLKPTLPENLVKRILSCRPCSTGEWIDPPSPKYIFCVSFYSLYLVFKVFYHVHVQPHQHPVAFFSRIVGLKISLNTMQKIMSA